MQLFAYFCKPYSLFCVFPFFVHGFSLSYSKSYKNLDHDYSNKAKHMYYSYILCLNFITSGEVLRHLKNQIVMMLAGRGRQRLSTSGGSSFSS